MFKLANQNTENVKMKSTSDQTHKQFSPLRDPLKQPVNEVHAGFMSQEKTELLNVLHAADFPPSLACQSDCCQIRIHLTAGVPSFLLVEGKDRTEGNRHTLLWHALKGKGWQTEIGGCWINCCLSVLLYEAEYFPPLQYFFFRKTVALFQDSLKQMFCPLGYLIQEATRSRWVTHHMDRPWHGDGMNYRKLTVTERRITEKGGRWGGSFSH